MPKIKLKPCPFCGGAGQIKNGVSFFWVQCESCTAKIDKYATGRYAADAWNTRFTEKETPPSANE